jgi:hypothetical protein
MTPPSIGGFKPRPKRSIVVQTATGRDIDNSQQDEIAQVDINIHADLAKKAFKSEYHGEASAMYNCHGLTFASRRTGIFTDGVVEMILAEEYQEIKEHKHAHVGDIVVWIDNDGQITHSAFIVKIEPEKITPGVFPKIRVLSKTRIFKEICHDIHDSPPAYGSQKRIYRIKHGPAVIT